MEASTIWWLLARAGGGRTAHRHVYLLMLPWAWVQRPWQPIWRIASTVQILTAALVGGGSVVGLLPRAQKRPGDPSAGLTAA